METREVNRGERRLIGVSLGVRTQAEAELALRDAARLADIAEIRLDLMDEYDLPRLLRDRPCPVVVTNRPEREGGRFRGGEAERVRPLREAIALGAEYVDVEHDAVHLVPERGATRLIVSYHDFSGAPESPLEIQRELAAKGADVVKIVGTARRLRDNLDPLDLLAQVSLPTIAMAMGEHGLVSRLLALRYDSCLLTYAALGRGERCAPGQVPVDTMRSVYHARRIGPQTTVYGVLSAQPAAERLLTSLNAATRAAGLSAVWLPFVEPNLTDQEVAILARAFRRHGVAGFLVAESAESAASAACDEAAARGPEGHVNALRWVGERLVGTWAVGTAEAFAFVTGRRVALTI